MQKTHNVQDNDELIFLCASTYRIHCSIKRILNKNRRMKTAPGLNIQTS